MKIQTITQIQAFLQKHFEFAECIIESIVFSKYATSVTICVNSIWDSSGNVREDLNRKRQIVVMEFQLVKTFTLINDWTTSMIEEPEAIGWGLNEIALVRSLPPESQSEPVDFVKVEFLWEGNRRIEVVFCGLDVTERDEVVIERTE